MEGWISLHRKLQYNKLWTSEPFSRGQAWVDLILLATHKDSYFFKRGIKVELKRGDVGVSQKGLSDRWGWSRGKTERFLNHLENEQQIRQQKTTVTTTITILNYNEYQKTNIKQSKKRTPNEHQTGTFNNVNNENNIKYREKIFHDEVILHETDFSHDLLKEFFGYWSEPNQAGNKMKKELEKTWDTKRRLNTWKRNKEKFSK